jgi:hypothetical protein
MMGYDVEDAIDELTKYLNQLRDIQDMMYEKYNDFPENADDRLMWQGHYGVALTSLNKTIVWFTEAIGFLKGHVEE